MNKGGLAAGIIVLLIIIAAIVVLIPHKAPTSITVTTIPSIPSAIATFQLTDPPEVPNGTQALVIDYSSVNAHVIAKNGTAAWIAAQGSGSVDLLSIVNMSQLIGKASVPLNSTIDMVRFNITGAKITIANSTYNVTVPNQQLIVHVSNSHVINGNVSTLIDMSPTIATIYTSNSTIFVLVPSVRAIVVGSNKANASASIGTRMPINATEKEFLATSKPSISIKSAALSQIGNTTTFSVTVANNGNSSIKIMHIMLFGDENVHIAAQGMEIGIEDNALHMHRFNFSNVPKQPGIGMGIGNMSIGSGFTSNTFVNISSGMGASGLGSFGMGNKLNASIGRIISNISRFGMNASTANMILSSLNESELEDLGKLNISSMQNLSEALEHMHDFNMSVENFTHILPNSTLARLFNITQLQKQRIGIGIRLMHYRVINFLVEQNGSLMLPFVSEGENEFEAFNGIGYTIPAKGSYTFTFTGSLNYANGNIDIAIIPGSTYKIVVMGDRGAWNTTNVTAG
ncbi:MAG: DUF4382 domain-containing protein [Candidatus Micrarchaeia archaeon]